MKVKKSISFLIIFLLSFCLFFQQITFGANIPNSVSEDPADTLTINQNQPTKTTAPIFDNPVCLLVGLSSTELSYREIASLSGFELFSVPYRSSIQDVVAQMKPTQVIIKHPSGFVGLYSVDGQLIRGVQTVNGSQANLNYSDTAPSIVQPYNSDPAVNTVFYPGAITGTIPHGGLNYRNPPKGRGLKRHFLKLAAFAGLVPFQYPGYFMAYNTYSEEKLFPALVFPNIPTGISAASAYLDAMFDQADYDEARTQPRDYMFQPIIESY